MVAPCLRYPTYGDAAEVGRTRSRLFLLHCIEERFALRIPLFNGAYRSQLSRLLYTALLRPCSSAATTTLAMFISQQLKLVFAFARKS